MTPQRAPDSVGNEDIVLDRLPAPMDYPLPHDGG